MYIVLSFVFFFRHVFRALQFLHSTHDRTSCGDQSTAHALKKAGSHWEYHRSQSCGGRRPGFALPEKVRSPPAMELGEVETRRGSRARLLLSPAGRPRFTAWAGGHGHARRRHDSSQRARPISTRPDRRVTVTEPRTCLLRRICRLLVVSLTRAADAGRATERATLSTLTVSLCAELSAGGAARENVVGGAGGSGLS